MFRIISDINVLKVYLRMAAEEPSFLVSLASGGAAGIAVDISLFPLDTIKTRSAAR